MKLKKIAIAVIATMTMATGAMGALRKNLCKFNNSDKKRYCGAA